MPAGFDRFDDFFVNSLEAGFSELPSFSGILVLMTTVLGSHLFIVMRTTSGGRDLGDINKIIKGGSGCGYAGTG